MMGNEKTDVKSYANKLIDMLNGIKDRHRNELEWWEIAVINDACNLIDHNLEAIRRK